MVSEDGKNEDDRARGSAENSSSQGAGRRGPSDGRLDSRDARVDEVRRKEGSPDDDVMGLGEFDPDAALVEVRAREAMEVLRRRSASFSGGFVADEARGGPMDDQVSRDASSGDSLPPAHWTRMPSPGPASGHVAGPEPGPVSGPEPGHGSSSDERASFVEVLPVPEPVDGLHLSSMSSMEARLPDPSERPGRSLAPVSGLVPERTAGAGAQPVEGSTPDIEDEGEDLTPLPFVEGDPSDPRFETEQDVRIPPGQESFRIGEVARIVGVKPHVLRFWETEFDWVEPEKTSTNQRRYRRSDVARLLQIRRLRHDLNLTVAQTRRSIEEFLRTGQSPRPDADVWPMPVGPRDASADDLRAVSPGHRVAVRGRSRALRQQLAEMRGLVLELLEAVEE